VGVISDGQAYRGFHRFRAVYEELALFLVEPKMQVLQPAGGWPAQGRTFFIKEAVVAGALETAVLVRLYQTTEVRADGIESIQTPTIVTDIYPCLRAVDQRVARVAVRLAEGQDAGLGIRRLEGEKTDRLGNQCGEGGSHGALSQ
jgi:hypothetical protein